MRAIIDREEDNGCGCCKSFCPDLYAMDGGKAAAIANTIIYYISSRWDKC